MDDIELESMAKFLNEFDDNEIPGSESPTSSEEQGITSADAAAVLLDKILESSLATSNSDAEETEESDSEDDVPLAVIMFLPARKRCLPLQRKYDKKFRKKKERNHVVMADTFVAGLKLLNTLLEDRIQRTKTVTMTRRLVNVDRNDKWYEFDLHTIEQEAKQQVALNHAMMQFVDVWVVTWCHSKSEYGQYFLKPWLPKIDDGIRKLALGGEKLAEETMELEFCTRQKPSGVWI